jgi:UDP-N-acetylmuramyl pentapeptide phosphotransferase/UDP-N-acetylglucosamine-1-phosphate transferase
MNISKFYKKHKELFGGILAIIAGLTILYLGFTDYEEVCFRMIVYILFGTCFSIFGGLDIYHYIRKRLNPTKDLPM